MKKNDIVELLSEVSRQFRTVLRHSLAVGGQQRALFQNEVLACIGRNPGISVMALANLTGRDKAQVTRVLADLEAVELVIRERSTLDRRSVKLRLTDEGQELFQRMLSERSALASAMLQPLSADEQQALFEMLCKLRSSFKDID